MFVSTAFAQTATQSPSAETVHTETGVAHDAGQQSGVFPPFDSTHYASQLLWLAITFGLFYLFMSKVVLPRIGGVIEMRRERIEQDLEQAARLKQDADSAIAAYEQELAEARKKATQIGQEARDNAKAQADAERHSLETELEAKLNDAEQRIAAIKDKAMGEVGAIAEELAGSVVEQLIGIKATQAETKAAIKAVNA